ncbi:MAG: hypothetical protein DSO04_02990 [Hadesarchaea archaeon]|nr:MAG: hypothetical protein DSO04_02990 [Hadesarchaea archaeon]
MRTLPVQSKLLLLGLLLLVEGGEERVTTGQAYEAYRRVALQKGVDLLTPRRVSDLLSELDMLGVVTTKILNTGRYGRTKEILLNLPPSQLRRILEGEAAFPPASLSLPRQTKLFW